MIMTSNPDPMQEALDAWVRLGGEVEVGLFQLAPNDGELGGGHYWIMSEHKLMRGPFATEEEAKADAERMGTALLAVILCRPGER
jgi:hypothetical protein